MPLDGKRYTVLHLKALISGLNISSCHVCGSTLTGPTLFQKLLVLHNKEAKSRFVLLFAIILMYKAAQLRINFYLVNLGVLTLTCCIF